MSTSYSLEGNRELLLGLLSHNERLSESNPQYFVCNHFMITIETIERRKMSGITSLMDMNKDCH